MRLQTPHGRLLVEAREPVPELPVGSLIAARGRTREPDEWEASRLERLGIATIVAASAVNRLASARRGGVEGLLDGLRSRAEDALGRGTSPPAASLLRGFVLGEDDRIAAPIVEQFKRSGLAHLLAVSGQNIVLLSVLATVVLAVARRAAAGAARVDPGGDRRLRAGRRRRPVDPARRRDGRGRRDRRARGPAAVALVRAPPRRRRDARARPSCDRGRRLAAQLRGCRRHPARGSPDLGDPERPIRGLAARARRRGGADDRGDARDRSPDGAPLRRRLDRRPARQPRRPARGRAGDVARHARRRGRPDSVAPGRAADLARGPARLLRRPGRRSGLPSRAGRSSTSASAPRCRCSPATWRLPPARRLQCAGLRGGARCAPGPSAARSRTAAGVASRSRSAQSQRLVQAGS